MFRGFLRTFSSITDNIIISCLAQGGGFDNTLLGQRLFLLHNSKKKKKAAFPNMCYNKTLSLLSVTPHINQINFLCLLVPEDIFHPELSQPSTAHAGSHPYCDPQSHQFLFLFFIIVLLCFDF